MTGDQTDVFKRLKSYLPPWFGAGPTPVLDSLIGGIAWALAGVYAFYAYAKLQTRIRTATGFWLDMIAADYFGTAIVRKPGQLDPSFRAYIIANLLRPRATRPSMQSLLLAITGQEPILFEPNRPYDTGAFHSPTSVGYFREARYGSLAVPFTAMITAYRPLAEGGLAGAGFYNAPRTTAFHNPLSPSYFNDLSLDTVFVDDADIYAAIEANKVAGTICWVALTAPPAPPPTLVGGQLDFSDANNSALLATV
jgi:hypothetical protein